MSSKAEKTSHNLHQPRRTSILFRNPVLLKIVAWLGCLGFIGSTGVVWADLKPISASQTEAQALVAAAPVRTNVVESQAAQGFGSSIPAALQQSFPEIAAAELPNREVPIAIVPASAPTQPAAKTARHQHADLLIADNHTVAVNGAAEESIAFTIPTPRATPLPGQSGEMATAVPSQVQPKSVRPQSTVSKSTPTTSIHAQAAAGQSSTAYRPVPKVVPLYGDTLKAAAQQKIEHRLPQNGQRSLSQLKSGIVTPMRPSKVTQRTAIPTETTPDLTLGEALLGADASIEIPVPPPRTQTIKVPAVAGIPQVTPKSIPTVAPIPTVRPATASLKSKPIAYINNGEHDSTPELIYPLSSPAPTTSSFGWRTHPITGSRRFHSGVDIGAPMGAPVVAAGSGTIISAGWVGGYGKAIIIQHSGVQQTLYGHLSEVFVQPGQKIEQGTVIGRVGSTGNSTGPHLHFESRMSTADGWVAVDPGDDIKYALDNLRRAMPFAQRDLPPGIH